MNIHSIYEAGFVARYHTKNMVDRQTINAHSWGVAVVLMWLFHPEKPPAGMLEHALLHDVAELITGDTPAPAKWRSPMLAEALDKLEEEVAKEFGVPAVTPEHSQELKFADYAELMLYSIEQANLGNRHFLKTAKKGLHLIGTIELPEELLPKKLYLIRHGSQCIQELE